MQFFSLPQFYPVCTRKVFSTNKCKPSAIQPDIIVNHSIATLCKIPKVFGIQSICFIITVFTGAHTGVCNALGILITHLICTDMLCVRGKRTW